jgi:hypothetical protein
VQCPAVIAPYGLRWAVVPCWGARADDEQTNLSPHNKLGETMTHRSNRTAKKLHEQLIDSLVIDVGQSSYWRKRLFDSADGDIFEISADHCIGLSESVSGAIRRFRLAFEVQICSATDAESWLSEGGMIIFRFSAASYPSVRRFSGNNPLVR